MNMKQDRHRKKVIEPPLILHRVYILEKQRESQNLLNVHVQYLARPPRDYTTRRKFERFI